MIEIITYIAAFLTLIATLSAIITVFIQSNVYRDFQDIYKAIKGEKKDKDDDKQDPIAPAPA